MGRGGGGGGRSGGGGGGGGAAPFSIPALNGQTRRVGEALSATAKVGRSKVWFNFGGNVGTVTWDLARGKWYGSPRLIPRVKRAFEVPS